MAGTVTPDFWHGKKVFLTGHTGFKGSWLALWLQQLGAEVKGYALAPPTSPALFEEARVSDGMKTELADIRDLSTLTHSMATFDPDVLIHMAAQPLVRLSYHEPVETYSTNVMGSLHVLEAARHCPNLRVIVNVTTDKCYENQEWVWGYRENEPMGGHDPYSSSKACAELLTAAYRNSYFHLPNAPALASARAGNVIGGGDWARDRLIPDILWAFEQGRAVKIRNPNAIRPWQHVLEPLGGYLVLAEKLWEQGSHYAQAWNFGPRDEDARPVAWILDRMAQCWGPGASWVKDDAPQPHEAHYLKLDTSKARAVLGWSPTWALETTLSRIVEWHHGWRKGDDVRLRCLNEIEAYQDDMADIAARL
ncbi:CDP-glucose 4,6-dehydratase [Vreelandella salicampi]|uniref:CDP-glucose 4,6-dehydratase n=1 Tax=Vreelandella salicampi TaxID=1449798 RepID=A0A7Z0RTQ9_9GAMM|nr:CDP-glucose 4,6-dehydratase [Halomonas salicampi]NYS59723.1 CDP-glucose 4,6-dehydratase [Halomonas salicampi]